MRLLVFDHFFAQDIDALARSAANSKALASRDGARSADYLANSVLDPFFEAVVQSIDEAVIDSMVANREMVGRDGTKALALPHDELRALLRRYGQAEED